MHFAPVLWLTEFEQDGFITNLFSLRVYEIKDHAVESTCKRKFNIRGMYAPK